MMNLVEYKKIVSKISIPADHKIKQKTYLQSGALPVIDQGQELVGGYTNDCQKQIVCDLPVIVFGDHTKNVKYINFPFCAGADGIKILKAKDDVFPKYLYYGTIFLTYCIEDKGYARHYQHIEKYDLLVPPLPEQERIVGKIEELFSQLDAAVAELKSVKEKLTIYRQAVLKEAFDIALKFTEKTMAIEDFLTTERKGMATGPFGTMLKKHEHKQSGVPMLGIENIGKGKFVDGNKIFVTPEKAKELKSFALETNDIIISRSGTVGEICAVPARMQGALLSTNLIRVSLNSQKVLSEYFIYIFQSKGVVLDQVKELCKGSTRIFLNQTILKSIKFPIPSIPKQKQIIDQIESQISICNNIEQTVNTALQQATALRQSILKQAFEGNL